MLKLKLSISAKISILQKKNDEYFFISIIIELNYSSGEKNDFNWAFGTFVKG